LSLPMSPLQRSKRRLRNPGAKSALTTRRPSLLGTARKPGATAKGGARLAAADREGKAAGRRLALNLGEYLRCVSCRRADQVAAAGDLAVFGNCDREETVAGRTANGSGSTSASDNNCDPPIHLPSGGNDPRIGPVEPARSHGRGGLA